MKGVTKTQHSALLISDSLSRSMFAITIIIFALASLLAFRVITSTCFLIFSQIFSPLRVCVLASKTLTEKHFPKAFRSVFESVHREFPMEHDLLFVTLCLLYFSTFQKAILETKKTKLDGWWSVDLFLSDVDFEFKLFRVSEGSVKMFSPRGCWTINKWS